MVVARWGGRGVALVLAGIHSLDGGFEVGGGQLTGGSRPELQTSDVLRHTEVLFRSCTFLHSYANGENGEVGKLDVLAQEKQLLRAGYCIGQDAFDGPLGEWGVVTCHVGCQLVEAYRLLGYDSWKPLAVSSRNFFVCVLIKDYSNHLLLVLVSI